MPDEYDRFANNYEALVEAVIQRWGPEALRRPLPPGAIQQLKEVLT